VGVFSFQDDDERWLSLRYDLTAPLARYVAENYQSLPKPFRRYQAGPVWRNEKPGPGRFRQFTQFDADTVGASSVAADAEMCMLTADTLEALGVPRGQYVIKVNDRKILDRILERWGVKSDRQRLVAMRAIDKMDRLGIEGVRALLGQGRKDESGDYTPGAGLTPTATDGIVDFLTSPSTPVSGPAETQTLSPELAEIERLVTAAGYGDGRIATDYSVVRGLEYYTGPVFEAELTAPIKDERGQKIRLGSVVSGGRYDGLVERFTGQTVPATGVSIGVSRLLIGLKALGKIGTGRALGPVVVLVLDRDRLADYQKMAQDLRSAGIRAEMYLGESGMKAQMKYADKRGAPCVVIQGSDEKEKGEVQIKDLVLGATLTAIEDRDKYLKKQAEAQFPVPQGKLVQAVRDVLSRHKV
jgi:histidyl-tRNA synthetase